MKINKTHTIFYEKYKPQQVQDLVLPQNLKDKIQNFVDKEDIPNMGLFSATPGCLLPGTKIQVQSESIWLCKKEVLSKYNLSKCQYSTLKKYTIVKRVGNVDLIDELSITKVILILVKNIKSGDTIYYNDRFYNDKHLTLNYWLYKLPYKEAVKKVKILRKYSEFFDIDTNYFLNKSYNKINLVETILNIKFKMIYYNFSNIKDLNPYIDKNWSVHFWTWRGYTVKEAENIISNIQKNNSNKKLIKYSNENMKKFSLRCKEYWIEKGYTELESIEKVKEVQSTFSLKKCIEKYKENRIQINYNTLKGTEFFNKDILGINNEI